MRRLAVQATILTAQFLGFAAFGGEVHTDSAQYTSESTRVVNSRASQQPISPSEAARFLAQASFGATRVGIDALQTLTYTDWLDAQFATPASLHYPLYKKYIGKLGNKGRSASNTRQEVWLEYALTAPDQLRQRLAFALSQILVVSERNSGLNHAQDGLAWYYDILVANAFGNFRELLEQVTLSPVMGKYLSMLGNQKPNPTTGVRADENFAREVMQLFTLGLHQLNIDGTPIMRRGQPKPTYKQADVENLARVFTGWWFDGAKRFLKKPHNFITPMVPYEHFHDRDPKTLVGGVKLPAGQDARTELASALDSLFQHPNAGPFISRQLIQKLVTSNPSPEYIARVARVFNNNGEGTRGDLQAVVRALLLDPEARAGRARNLVFGRPREPLLALVHLWRASGVEPDKNGRYSSSRAHGEFSQAVLAAPSVFNFYDAGYAAPGAISATGLLSPEFQLANESSITKAYNRFYKTIFNQYVGKSGNTDMVRIRLDALAALSADPSALIDHLDLLLTSGQMSVINKRALITYLNSIPREAGGGRRRAQEALYLIITSPQYLVQK